MSYKIKLAEPVRKRLAEHLPAPLLLRLAKHLADLGHNPKIGRRPPPGPLEPLGMMHTFTLEAPPLAKTVTVFYRYSADEKTIEISEVQVGRT